MQKFILITKIENTVTVAVKSKHMFILLRDKLALAPFNTKKTGSTFEFTLSYDELKNILAKNSQTKIENMHVNGIKNFYKKVSEQHPKLEGLKSLLEELGREVEFEHVEKILNKYAKVVESKEVSALKEKEVTSSTTQNIVQPAVKVSQVVATQFAKPVDKKEDVKTVPLVYLKQ